MEYTNKKRKGINGKLKDFKVFFPRHLTTITTPVTVVVVKVKVIYKSF
jgi:hypothetical protein